MPSDQEFTRRMLQTVLTVAAVGILLAALWVARDALMLIYVSALIAMGLSPVVRLLEHPTVLGKRRNVPRVLAILVVYVVVVAVLIAVGLLVVPSLIEQAAALWERMPQHFNDFQRTLIRYRLAAHRITFQEAVQNAPAGSGGNAVNAVLSAVWTVGGGIFGLITIAILTFYFLVEADGMEHSLARFLPASQRAHAAAAAAESVGKVSAWLRAQLILGGVMGTVVAAGLGLLHVPYFYVVALIAAVGETIPVVGPIIAGAAAVAVAMTVSTNLALAAGGFFLILHQLEANILVPKIMERRVGVSPVTVMVALLIGGDLWGLVGAILAIPTAAILSVVVEEFSGQANTDTPMP
jgi:predicted PurR-regulated permease PerM